MKDIVEADVPRVEKLLLDVLDIPAYQAIKRLGGLTNRTYKVDVCPGKTYVVRIPGEGTENLINRKNEQKSTKLACEVGVDAPLLYFGPNGEKISSYIEGARTMVAGLFRDERILCKAAQVFRAVHTSGVDTNVPFVFVNMVSNYEKIIREHSVDLFDEYEKVKTQIFEIKNYVDRFASVELVPCHNDPLCENWILDRDNNLYLIDWEYAGMNDAMWDLADLSIEAVFSHEQEQSLLCYYYGRKPQEEESIRFHANKLYLDFLWALWAKTRVPFDGNDIDQYGVNRYMRLQKNLHKFVSEFL